MTAKELLQEIEKQKDALNDIVTQRATYFFCPSWIVPKKFSKDEFFKIIVHMEPRFDIYVFSDETKYDYYGNKLDDTE